MAMDASEFDEWETYESDMGHQFRYPTSGTGLDASQHATLVTADGTEVSVGDEIEFERFTGCPYLLQAFHDIRDAEYCFVDFHFNQNAPYDDVFVSGFDMGWAKLATLLDRGAAWLVDDTDDHEDGDPSDAGQYRSPDAYRTDG